MNLKTKLFAVCCLLSFSLLIHAEKDVQKQAKAISKKYIIADLHVDVPYRLKEQYEDVEIIRDMHRNSILWQNILLIFRVKVRIH